MQNGTEQETSLEVINLAPEMKQRQEIVQVQSDIIGSDKVTSFTFIILKLKVYGHHGTPGDHVQVHVTQTQKEIELAPSQEAICLALVMPLRMETVQV